MKQIALTTCLLLKVAILSAKFNFVKTLPSCPTQNTGRIDISLQQWVIDDYDFPYYLEWENLSTGDYGTLQIDTIPTQLVSIQLIDVWPGEYEIMIHVSQDCIIETETIVKQDCPVPIGLSALLLRKQPRNYTAASTTLL